MFWQILEPTFGAYIDIPTPNDTDRFWNYPVQPTCPGRDGVQSVQASRGFSEIPHVTLPTSADHNMLMNSETVATVALRQSGIVLSQQDPVSRGKRRNLSNVFSCLSCLALFTCVCVYENRRYSQSCHSIGNTSCETMKIKSSNLVTLGGFPTFFIQIHNIMSILSHYKGHLSRRIFAALIFDASRIYCNWHQISRGRQGTCPGGRAKLMDPKLDDWCDILGPYIWSYMIIYDHISIWCGWCV